MRCLISQAQKRQCITDGVTELTVVNESPKLTLHLASMSRTMQTLKSPKTNR